MQRSSFEDFVALERRLQDAASPGTRPGLSRLARLCRLLDHPERSFRAVHVVGTNGKGSTAATLASILAEAHCSVGLYTSPHLTCVDERIRLNGKTLSFSLWQRGSEVILEAIRKDEKLALFPPTLFEVLTALAFWLFREVRCEIAVFEAGMGGRLDATNLLSRIILTLVTPIAEDHSEYLGETLEEIAGEKFAVLRPGVPALFAGGGVSLERQFLERARKIGAEGHLLSEYPLDGITLSEEGTFFGLTFPKGERRFYRTPLLGCHQAINASMALCGAFFLRSLYPRISGQVLTEGLAKTRWPGRLEIISRNPFILLDGGHNPHGLSATLSAVDEIWGKKKGRLAFFAAMADKDYRSELALIHGGDWRILCTEVPGVIRGEKALTLAETAREIGLDVIAADANLERAFAIARRESDFVLCCGSLYLIGALKALWGGRR